MLQETGPVAQTVECVSSSRMSAQAQEMTSSLKAESGPMWTWLNRKRTPVHPRPIYIQGERDNVQVEVCFQYFDGYSERLFSYVNNINTRRRAELMWQVSAPRSPSA